MGVEKEKSLQQAREHVSAQLGKVREFMAANAVNAETLRNYAEMLIKEAELVRLQWLKDKA